MEKDFKLDVPYYSQYIDIPKTLDGVRSCGITCAKMILEFYKKTDKSLEELRQEGMQNGGYGPSGWIHEYFVNLFKANGLDSYRKEKMTESEGLEEITKSLQTGNLVIVSVTVKLFQEKNFHMVLLVGFKTNEFGKLDGFYYHNPAKTSVESGQSLFVEIDDFLNYWRKMAIFVTIK